MIKKDNEDLKNFTKRWICEETYKGEVKVKDHGYITGKYWRSAQNVRNLNLNPSEKTSVAFHNLQTLTYILFLKMFFK